jgi:hypothetical protein
MAVETGQAVRAKIYNRVTTDETMKSVFGQSGVIYMYEVQADVDDPAFPYIVDRLLLGKDLLYGTHTYYLDFWDYDKSLVNIKAALDRLKILFHEWTFTTADSEASGFLEWFSGGLVPTDQAKVRHLATQWDVKFGAGRDITNIVG